MGIRRLTSLVLVFALVSSACSGSSDGAAQSAVDDATQPKDEATTELDVAEPTPTLPPTAEPTPVPTQAPTPEPTATPDPDRDGDGVLNEDDEFPDDANRSVALVSQFPLVDGVNQLDEDLPSVQALRDLQEVVLAPETDPVALEARFAPSFLQAVPISEVTRILDEIRESSGGVWEVVDVRAVTQWWLWVQLGDPERPSAATHLVRVGVDPNTGLINEAAVNPWRQGLQAQQYVPDQTKDLDEVVADLATKADMVGVLVADVTPDGCTTRAAHNAEIPLGTASVYKLWVLGAAATEVDAGRLDRGQTVTFAPGEFMAAGAATTGQFATTFELTLQQAANLMMNRSDNGATDMVERTVGRQAAWDFVDDSGHTDPDLLNPIIGIRDYDHLFSSVSPAQVDQYLTGSEDEQEAFIVDVLDPLGPTRLGLYGNGNTREYTWQASPQDICETMATLTNRFAPDSEAGRFIDEAFSGEVALFGVRNTWDRTWSKGGSIPGGAPGTNVILTYAFLVQSNDGDAHSVVVMFNSDQGFEINPLQFEAASLMSRIFEILAADNA